jgi:hypothetical protein
MVVFLGARSGSLSPYQNYLYPDIILEIKFDKPTIPYDKNSKVVAPVVIRKTKMPKL